MTDKYVEKMLRRHMPKMCEDKEKILEALSEFISMLDYEYDDGKCRIEGHLFQANGETEEGVIAWPTSSLPCSLVDFFLGEAKWPKEVKIKINTSMIKISAEELSRMFPLIIREDADEQSIQDHI